MYVYLYDNFLRQKKYDGIIKEIETRLTDYGIAGKIIRLQHYTNAKTIVDEETKKGAKTVVIVGNDITFGHVLSRAATSSAVFGFLPIGPENAIANVLGIPVGVDSCDVLSRRRNVRLDVGWFNNRYFVSRLNIPPSDITIQYDEQFSVSATRGKMELVVCNLQPYHWKVGGRRGKEIVVHPQDGKLEAFVRPVIGKAIIRNVYEEPSIFPFEEMVVTSKKPFVVEADGKTSKETKITIKLAKKRIGMIVGKERKF